MKARAGYVALLRGIVVGYKNLLPMNELVEIFVTAGCAHAPSQILIQKNAQFVGSVAKIAEVAALHLKDGETRGISAEVYRRDNTT
jgi:uncharacterized protein (DUF1697 family)